MSPKLPNRRCVSTYPDPETGKIAQCPRKGVAKGFCWAHYQRVRRGINPNTPRDCIVALSVSSPRR